MVKKFNILSIFIVFLLLHPFLDVLTNLLLNTFKIDLSLGVFVRSAFMLVFMVYIFKEVFAQKDRFAFFHIVCIMLVTGLQFFATLLFKEGFSFSLELTFIIKTIYPIILFFALYYLAKNKELIRRVVDLAVINGIFVSLFIIVPTAFGFSFDSYKNGLKGSLGLYSSGNEVSAILMFTYFFAVYSLFYRKNIITPVITIFLITIASFYVGTKVAIGALIVIASLFTLAVLLFRIKDVRKMSIAYLILPFAVALFIFNGLPAAENSQLAEEQQKSREEKYENAELYFEDEKLDQVTEIVELRNRSLPIVTKILSSRDVYAIQTFDDFSDAPLLRKLFGLGYAGDYYNDFEVKIVEMDIVDYAYSYGIFGLLYLLFVVAILFKLVGKAVLNSSGTLRGKLLFVAFSFLLTMAVSTLAGHIWFAPAVSIYLAIIGVLLVKLAQEA